MPGVFWQHLFERCSALMIGLHKFFSMKNVKFRSYISECCLASVYYRGIDDHVEVRILVNSVLMISLDILYRSNDVSLS